MKRRPHRPPAPAAAGMIVLLFLVSACSSGTDDRFTVTVEDGVRVAETHGGPLYEGDLFTLREVVTLQEDPSNEASLMSAPGLFSAGPNGHYYVADSRQNAIFEFDADGAFVRRFGGPGDGPGEFRFLAQVRYDGQTIWTYDFQLQRATRFGLDGRFLDVVQAPSEGLIVEFEPAPEGRWYVAGAKGREEGSVGFMSRAGALVAADRDTLAAFQTPFVASSFVSIIETSPGQTSMLSIGVPFAPYPILLHAPGRGVVAAAGDSPDLTWYGYDGEPTLVVRTGLETRPVTAKVRADFEAREWADRERRAKERGTAPTPLPEYWYPDTCGFWSWGAVDDYGYVWLLDTWTETVMQEGEAFLYHVIDPEGRYLGTTHVGASRFVIGGGRLYARRDDPETGARIPAVYEIVPAVDGLTYGPGGAL